MIGKTFKSKINNELFYVEELKNDNNNDYYVILVIKTGHRVICGKDWFENGIMQNLEEVKGGDIK